ncbi:hypothetical protein D3C75_1369560 [compost metagenome]
MIDEAEIRHLLLQQFAVGLLVTVKVGRLMGRIGVTVEHEAGAADGQQDAPVAGKRG